MRDRRFGCSSVFMAMVGTVLFPLVVAVVIKWAPAWLATTRGLGAAERAAELGRIRTALLAVIAGLIAIVGAAYTAKTYALNREGQITERFTRAVDQLGNDKVDVRLGGIYALERVAQESPLDHPAILEILAAFVRQHSGSSTARVAADVKAALVVVGRRRTEHDKHGGRATFGGVAALDLSGANLPSAEFSYQRLPYLDLSGADVTGAKFFNADLIHANFSGATLDKAHLVQAELSHAVLDDASLAEADLRSANLRGANLIVLC